MLTHLHVRDFAIIDQLDVDFNSGLNIITGETGAGKSIVIEAVSLALGSRADTAFIRSGKEKAMIQLVAENCLPELNALLEENGIPVEDQLIIKRELSTSGKNICRINDTIVSLSFLNKICRYLADIHGQYDHQALLHPENHIHLLDLYDGKKIAAVKEKVSSLFSAYTKAKNELNSLKKNEAEALRKRDFMEFELNEIEAASLTLGEDVTLEQQILLLQNSEKIFKTLEEAYTLLSDSPAALECLGRSMNLLSQISDLSSSLKKFSDDLSDCFYKLEDSASDLRRYKDELTFSSEELDTAMARMDLIDMLKRKYGGTLEDVLAYGEQIEKQLSLLESSDERKQQLEKEVMLLREQLTQASASLTKLRQKSADSLSEKITKELKELNFQNARLSVHFEPLPDKLESAFREDGVDLLEFRIATNKGETEKPLSKIASGGEISRIMLAFKQIIGDLDQIPTLIFDEIDSGISGITASIVGKKLKEIAGTHQVICITHLPQIAACGAYHYKIQKSDDDISTHTTVISLTHEQRVEEIARLLGGINITETTKKSAEELLALSQQ